MEVLGFGVCLGFFRRFWGGFLIFDFMVVLFDGVVWMILLYGVDYVLFWYR